MARATIISPSIYRAFIPLPKHLPTRVRSARRLADFRRPRDTSATGIRSRSVAMALPAPSP